MTDAVGNRVTWAYDKTYQLTKENRTGTNPFNTTTVYDSRGNRLVQNATGARITSTYDQANQLKYNLDATGRTTYTFDANGNQQIVQPPIGNRTTNVWDYENQTISVQNPDGSRVTMAYNADNRRVRKDT